MALARLQERRRLWRGVVGSFPSGVQEAGGIGDEGAQLLAAGAVLFEHGTPVQRRGALYRAAKRAFLSGTMRFEFFPGAGHPPAGP